MPRYKEYNRKRVLDIAMKEIWQNGFQATSVQRLSAIMNINKNTLYQEFENKEGLLAASMEHFWAYYCTPLINEFQTSPASEESLLRFFCGYLEHLNSHRNGCYILSITTETGKSVITGLAILKAYTEEIEESFVYFIQKMQLFDEPTEVRKKAMHLNHLFLSVMLISSLNSYQYCLDYIQQMLEIIDLKF